MAETYKPILSGNWVTHLNAHALPNESFKANKRLIGAPQDRHYQALLFTPGWMSVRKVGWSWVDEAPQSSWDIILPSPDLRPDDKPRADVIGMWAPKGAFLVRAGFRVLPASSQPGSSSSGPRDEGSLTSGIVGEPGGVLVLSTEAPTAPAIAMINGTLITTASDASAVTVTDENNLPIGSQLVSAAFGTPQRVEPDEGLTLRLYSMDATAAAESPLTTQIIGGAYIVSELVYMVPESVCDLDDVHLSGARYSGFTR
jgi:hypothetical protein